MGGFREFGEEYVWFRKEIFCGEDMWEEVVVWWWKFVVLSWKVDVF